MGKADTRDIILPLSAERPMAEFFRDISRDTTQKLGIPKSLLGLPVRFSSAVPEGEAYLIPSETRFVMQMKFEEGQRRMWPTFLGIERAVRLVNSRIFSFMFGDAPRKPWKEPITDDMTQMVYDLQNAQWWR